MSSWDIKVDGVWHDWETFGVRPIRWKGTGMPTVKNQYTEYAMQPGGFHQGLQIGVRKMMFTCIVAGGISAVHAGTDNRPMTNLAGLHTARVNFIDLFKPANGQIQVREIRYRGTDVNTKITVRYDGGLEHLPNNRHGYMERVHLSLLSTIIFWQEESISAQTLNSQQTTTDNTYVQKSASGYTFYDHPSSVDIRVMFVKDDVLYTAESSGLTTTVRTRENDAWSQVGNIVTEGDTSLAGDLIVDENGVIWLANADGGSFKLYELVSNTWVQRASITTGGPNIRLLSIPGRDLWLYGNSRLMKYVSGTGLSTIATAFSSRNIFSVVYHNDNYLYIGGDFTFIIQGSVNGQLVRYDIDTDTWSEVAALTISSGLAGVYYLQSSRDYLHIFGRFDTIDGVTATHDAKWNGFGFSESEFGVEVLNVDQLDFDQLSDGSLIVTNDRKVQIYDEGWTDEPVQTPSGASTLAATSDGYIVYDSDATFTVAGESTATITGTADVHPWVTFENTTTNTIDVYQIQNLTGGHRVWFENLDVLPGEIITVHFGTLEGLQARVSSNFRGTLSGRIGLGSEQESFVLLAADSPLATERDNTILLYTSEAGLTVTLHWIEQHWSCEGGVTR